MNVYEHVFQAVSGATMPLRNWTGQPLLIVNTASQCDYATQLHKLQRLYMDYRQSNLVVLAVPCDDYGGKEPDTEEEFAPVYWDEYGVTFPITRKARIRGLGSNSLFMSLMDSYGEDVMPRWNYHKYLFDTRGELAEHWPAQTEPDDPKLTHQVERELRSWVF